jgi:hypothetical protein
MVVVLNSIIGTMVGVSLQKRIVIIKAKVIVMVVAGLVDYGETYSERHS